MSIKIKTPEQIEKLREAGRLAAEVLLHLAPHVQAGVTTNQLDELAQEKMREQGTTSATLGYHGYPKSICTSINKVVCHGIPNDKPLKKGDIINVDVTIIKDGFHGDTSMMFEVGEVHPSASRLIKATYEAMWQGIKAVKEGVTLYDVAEAIEKYALANHLSVVQEYCGHGIGEEFHEEPQVLHYTTPELKKIKLKEGMVFTIEPMLNLGKAEVKAPLRDGWTVHTRDGSLSAQWEHMVAVTKTGVDVLTLRPDETPPN